ncbi:MAG: hypothetical protein CL952_01740 [Erythrobacteraceae bacterium]|nr:hypothetical protein [Erythrobacteraceae bacterium]|tara:strand:+ start:1286 stop:2059 length:774 start_codon:yes stop_codon:yes gene_type:complete
MTESAGQKAKREAHNARVEAFSKRTDLVDLSPREYSDAYSECLRQSNIDMLEGFERLGWMTPKPERYAAMHDAFAEYNFEQIPKSGWDSLVFELDLIFVQFDVPDTSKGHAKLRREIETCVQKLKQIRETFFSFNHSTDFMWASMMSKAETNEHIPTIEALIKSHETVAQFLAERAQPPRWREKTLRKSRIELATKLLTIFEREFGQVPKPDGGSAHIPIADANNWQRFFQACAFIRLGERETPDRQSVLWEAYGNW